MEGPNREDLIVAMVSYITDLEAHDIWKMM